jgi:hypothetical protein
MAVLIRTISSGIQHTAHRKRKLWEFHDPSLQLHTPISSVLCMAVVKTPTIIFNNPVFEKVYLNNPIIGSYFFLFLDFSLSVIIKCRCQIYYIFTLIHCCSLFIYRLIISVTLLLINLHAFLLNHLLHLCIRYICLQLLCPSNDPLWNPRL